MPLYTSEDPIPVTIKDPEDEGIRWRSFGRGLRQASTRFYDPARNSFSDWCALRGQFQSREPAPKYT